VALHTRYRLEGLLGEGSTGVVYRATSVPTGVPVALKRVRASGGRVQMAAEVAALEQLTHPNVVRLLDHGEDDAGPWLVTELVTGASLRQLLEHTGALAPEQALGVLTGALSGLGAIHAAGMVHGDMKPENILVEAASGTSKLTDVGVPGAGSPGYQAPELLAGGRPDVRSDLYAVGVVLFEALVGRPPFHADRPETLAHLHAQEPVPLLPQVPTDLDALVRRCMAKDRAARPESAHALLDDLERAARAHYGADWRVRASVTALSAAIGAEGALVGLTEAAGAPPPHGPLQAASGTHGAREVAAGHPGQVATAQPSPPAPVPKTPSPTHLFRVGRMLRYAAVHKAASVAVSVAAVAAVASGGYAVARVVSAKTAPEASAPAAAAAPTPGPTTSTSTSTTTTTTTTTVPVATPTTLPVVVCPLAGPPPPLGVPAPLSTASATVTPAQANQLELYTDPLGVLLVLAPRGWTCGAEGDGALGYVQLIVVPPGTANPAKPGGGGLGSPIVPSSDEAINAMETGGGPGAGYSQVCPFSSAAVQGEDSQGSSCKTPPNAEGIDWIQGSSTSLTSTDIVGFEDPPGVAGNGSPSGGPYPANGVVIFGHLPPTLYSPAKETCTLPSSEHALCTAILNDFIDRYGNS